MGFGKALTGITLLALVIRLAFALTIGADRPNGGVDADRYVDIATTLASGKGYSFHPDRANFGAPNGTSDRVEPDGQRPPLHPALLALADVLGFHSWNAHRVVASIVASLGVAITGLLGRRLLSPSVGLVAAGLAAVHPLWFQYSGYLISEATFLLVIPLTLLAAALALDTGARAWHFALLGGAIGLSALTRTEALALFPVLGLPVAFLTRDRRRLRAVALVGLGTLVVVGPWVLRNDRTFGSPSISFNGGLTLAGANCDKAYYGQYLGSFRGCALAAAAAIKADHPGEALGQAERDREGRKLAIDYARAHLSRTPVVALARIGRTAGVFRLRDSMDFDVGIGADRRFQWAGYAMHLVLAPIAIAGAVLLVRRRARRTLLVLAAGPILALITGITVYGATRMRVAAEPAEVVLAALALVAAWQRWQRHRSAPRAVRGVHISG